MTVPRTPDGKFQTPKTWREWRTFLLNVGDPEWPNVRIALLLLTNALRSGEVTPEQAEEALVDLDANIFLLEESTPEDVDRKQRTLRDFERLKQSIAKEHAREVLIRGLAGAKAATFKPTTRPHPTAVMVHPTPRPDADGRYQITYFGEYGGEVLPGGHQYAQAGAGFEDAVREAWREWGPFELIERANPPRAVDVPGWRMRWGEGGRRTWEHESGRAIVMDSYGRPHPYRYQVLVRMTPEAGWVESDGHPVLSDAFDLASRDLASMERADAFDLASRDLASMERVERVSNPQYGGGTVPRRPARAALNKLAKTLGAHGDAFLHVIGLARINGRALPYWVLTDGQRDHEIGGDVSDLLEEQYQTALLGVHMVDDGPDKDGEIGAPGRWYLWRCDWRVWNDEHAGGVAARGNPPHAWLPLRAVKRYEAEAARRGVSEVARSSRGFLSAYKRAGGRPERMDSDWHRKREAFIARHMAQAEHEALTVNGEPSRRHLALIMWAYSPSKERLAMNPPSGGVPEYVARYLEHAPPASQVQVAPGLAGWLIADGWYLCGVCAGRIMGRGGQLPPPAVAVWIDTPVSHGACLGCGAP